MNKLLISLSVMFLSGVLGVMFATNTLPKVDKIFWLSLAWLVLAVMAGVITWLNTEKIGLNMERSLNNRLGLALIAPTIFGIIWVIAMVMPG